MNRTTRPIKILRAVMALSLTSASLVLAANGTWTGASGSSWFDDGNWQAAIPGSTTGTTNTDEATFNIAVEGGSTVTFDVVNLRAVFLGTSAGDFTFNGNQLRLTGHSLSGQSGRIFRSNVEGGITTVNSNVILEAGTETGLQYFLFDNRATNVANAMHITGNVSGGTSELSMLLQLGGTNSGANEVSGIISNGSSSGGVSITKINNGVWTLSGANTYSGGTTISAGRMNVNHASALGTGNITFSGGTLGNTSGGAITLSANNTQTWSGSLNFSLDHDLNMGNGDVTLMGNVSMRSQGTSGKLIVGGNISDGGNGYGISKITDVGELVLNGNLTYGGATTVSNGTLTLGGENTYAGGTTVGGASSQNGHLNINNAKALGSGTLTIASPGGARLGNTSGAAVVVSSNNTQVWNNGFTFFGPSNLDLGTGTVSLGTASGTSRTITVNEGILSVGGVISNGTTANSLTKSGADVLRLGGNNQYTGTTTVTAGTLVVNGHHSGGGAYTIQSGGTLGGAGQISTAGNAGVTLSSGAKLAPGDILGSGRLTLDLGTGSLNISSAVSGANQGALMFQLGTSLESDRIVLSNALSLLVIGTGALQFNDFQFTALSGFAPGQYVLFSTGREISGTLGATLTGQIGAFDAAISMTEDKYSIMLTVVPEPGTASLLLLIGAYFIGRRKVGKRLRDELAS